MARWNTMDSFLACPPQMGQQALCTKIGSRGFSQISSPVHSLWHMNPCSKSIKECYDFPISPPVMLLHSPKAARMFRLLRTYSSEGVLCQCKQIVCIYYPLTHFYTNESIYIFTLFKWQYIILYKWQDCYSVLWFSPSFLWVYVGGFPLSVFYVYSGCIELIFRVLS